MSDDPQQHVAELIFGKWKSRVLYAGVKLGVMEALAGGPKAASALAGELALDAAMAYRLLRAMASIGLLREEEGRLFALTEEGRCLLAAHPRSLRSVALLQEGPEHSAIWKHLPEIVRHGQPHGFFREYGHSAFDHVAQDSEYARLFDSAMNSYSASHTQPVLAALHDFDFSGVRTVCDIGGGYGYLLCGLLREQPHLQGVVLERAGILADPSLLEANRAGLAERCQYVAGNMFEQVPAADLYLLKLILHDWPDADGVRILASARRATTSQGRVLVIEHIVPGPGTPHFAKLYDIHMMCWGPGRERTAEEYAALLEEAGWRYAGTRIAAGGLLGIVEGSV